MSSSGKQLPQPSPVVKEQASLDPLATIQERFALLNLDGSLWILDQRRIRVGAHHAGSGSLSLSNLAHGKLLIVRAVREQFPQADGKTIAEAFLHSPGTTCYVGIEFNPRGTTPDYLNRWVGPTIEPVAGNALEIKRFLFEVICNRDPKVYEYLLLYLAHALQRPWEKPGVMITLLGGQGTGKGTFGQILRKIWSATYLQVHNIDAIVGSFNGCLERAYIVFIDEALFAGNRRGTDALKSLVSEPTIQINEKHQPNRQIQSYHRYFIATNARHLKHTERDDRRDFALRLSEHRKSDHAYWERLHKDIEGGGVAALVHELLNEDLSNFNVREKPTTPELLEQKLLSLEGIERWWFDSLQSGAITGVGGWVDFISTQVAIDGVGSTPGIKLYKRPIGRELVRTVLRLCPSAQPDQRRIEGNRQRGLMLPSLDVARAEFEAWIGGAVDW